MTYKSSIKIAIKIPDLNLETNVCNNLSGLFLKKNRPQFAMQVTEYSIKNEKLTNYIRGLGLAIVKRLVKLHGSQIKVQSKEQEGSEFYFNIKLKKVGVNKVSKINDNNYSNLQGRHVLLAEDTP